MKAIAAELWRILELAAGTREVTLESVAAVVAAVLAYFFVTRWTGNALGAKSNYYGFKRWVGIILSAVCGLLIYAASAAHLVPLTGNSILQWVLRVGVPLLLMLAVIVPAMAWLMKWSYVETAGGILFGGLAALLAVILVHGVAGGIRGGMQSAEGIRSRTKRMEQQVQ